MADHSLVLVEQARDLAHRGATDIGVKLDFDPIVIARRQ